MSLSRECVIARRRRPPGRDGRRRRRLGRRGQFWARSCATVHLRVASAPTYGFTLGSPADGSATRRVPSIGGRSSAPGTTSRDPAALAKLADQSSNTTLSAVSDPFTSCRPCRVARPHLPVCGCKTAKVNSSLQLAGAGQRAGHKFSSNRFPCAGGTQEVRSGQNSRTPALIEAGVLGRDVGLCG